MWLIEAFARERAIGEYRLVVKLIRHNVNSLSIEEMSDFFSFPIDSCKKVIEALNTHPDWDDDKIAEELYWDE